MSRIFLAAFAVFYAATIVGTLDVHARDRRVPILADGGSRFVVLDSGFGATASFDTASVSPASDSVVYVFATVAVSGTPTDAIAVTGLGSPTWTKQVIQQASAVSFIYGGRRINWRYRATGTIGTGAITINYTGGGTYAETFYIVLEDTAPHATVWDDDGDAAAANSTSIAIAPLGSITGGDVVLSYGCTENSGGDNMAIVDIDEYLLSPQTGGTDVRSCALGISTTDDSPSLTTDGTNNNGISGFKVHPE